jgi:hypothetical protein
MSENQKPVFSLMGKTLEDMISFAEEFTGEKMKLEEVEELRQSLAEESSSQS